ncbi:sortase B protein-sorting domain-containing protein, partial [Lactobacillus amylovorus]
NQKTADECRLFLFMFIF